MHSILRDFRYAWRNALLSPGFTLAAVVTLGLGIGANAAIFSLVSAVLLRPLPYPNPDQLVGLGQWRNQPGEGYVQTGVSAPNLVDIAAGKTFQQVAWYRWAGLNITEGDRPQSVDSIAASADLLPMFGVRPMLGRYLTAAETEPGYDSVAVLGFHLWQMRYGSDPEILGKTIELDRRHYTIVGVMPASFRFTWDEEMDVFVPLVLTAGERSEAGRGTSRDLQAQARLRNGVGVAQAQAAMNTLADALAVKYPAADAGWGFKVEPLHAAYHRQMQTPLAIMLAAVMLVLLIACANVANLLLARATSRRREMAIRIAVGASRGRLIRQLLNESLLLAFLGGILGLTLAYAGDRLLTLAMARYQLSVPNARIIDIDWRVLAFSAAVTLATAIVFGLAPALALARTEQNEALKEGAVNTTGEGGRRRLRNLLVICEVALALTLLTGAGLLVRTFVKLANVDLGMDPRGVLTMGIRLPAYKYSSEAQQALFYRELMQRLERVPGVSAAGASSGGGTVFFQAEGQPAVVSGKEPLARLSVVTNGFFQAMRTGLARGRYFDAHDKAGSLPVAIVSEALAKRYWPHASPLGKHLNMLAQVYSGQTSGIGQPLEIVGVVHDMRIRDVWQADATIYRPFEQKPADSVFLAIRASVPTFSIESAVRGTVLAIDKQQPVNRIRSMEEIMAETYGVIRFPMMLVWIFAALALALSAVGTFGVMSYAVSRRTKELALRMALGASPGELLRLVMREGMATTAIALPVGFFGALAFGRVLSRYLYGISATDPVTFACTAAVLIAVALLSTYLPARRVSRVDPMASLRCE